MPRFKTLLALACTALMTAAIFSATATAANGKHAKHHAVHKRAAVKVNVTMGEFFFKFSRKSVSPGSKVIFTVTNKGKLAHDLDFTTLHKKTPLVKPGKKVKLTVVFAKKKGKYHYICSVPGHAQAGMAGNLVVK